RPEIRGYFRPSLASSIFLREQPQIILQSTKNIGLHEAIRRRVDGIWRWSPRITPKRLSQSLSFLCHPRILPMINIVFIQGSQVVHVFKRSGQLTLQTLTNALSKNEVKALNKSFVLCRAANHTAHIRS